MFVPQMMAMRLFTIYYFAADTSSSKATTQMTSTLRTTKQSVQTTPLPCTNEAGTMCSDAQYLKYTCNDTDLSVLCVKACGLCT